MIVYHGTSHASGDLLQTSKPEIRPRDYFGGRKAFCCSESFDAAQWFAVRRSGQGMLHGDFSRAGVVLEYVLSPANDGQTFFRARDRCTLQDEREVLIPDPSKLILQAIHRLDASGNWKRFALVADLEARGL